MDLPVHTAYYHYFHPNAVYLFPFVYSRWLHPLSFPASTCCCGGCCCCPAWVYSSSSEPLLSHSLSLPLPTFHSLPSEPNQLGTKRLTPALHPLPNLTSFWPGHPPIPLLLFPLRVPPCMSACMPHSRPWTARHRCGPMFALRYVAKWIIFPHVDADARPKWKLQRS